MNGAPDGLSRSARPILIGMEAFFLDPANRDFAEGKGPYRPKDVMPTVRSTRTIFRFLLWGGVLATLVAGVLYLSRELSHEQLLASVKTVTAQVSGCEGPWKFEHVRFRYTVGGKVYDQSAYAQKPEFMWASILPDACKTMTVELNYLTSDPNRWSVATISPLTWEERDAKPNPNMFLAGAILLALSGVFAFANFLFRKESVRQDALKATGIVLNGELLRMEEDASQDSANLFVCYYQFKNPAGVLLSGKSTSFESDLKKSEYPQPGTPVYVVYATDQTFQML